MRAIAFFTDKVRHCVPAASSKWKRTFFRSTASPPLCTISTRTGSNPASNKFDSNSSCVSSSVKSGAARNEMVPRLTVGELAGSEASAAGGFTLYNVVLHDAVNRMLAVKKYFAAVRRYE